MNWTTGIDLDARSVLQFVRKEIDEYDYGAIISENKAMLIGSPIHLSDVEARLDRFRQALVEPYWVEAELRDTHQQVASVDAELAGFMVITDDRDGYLLAFDPERRDFALIDPRNERLVTIGVRGDPVGCYLAM